MKQKSFNKGFSLVEVMIALVILAVGILGISKLQGVLIKNSSYANQRAAAMSLAQQKIDDLRSFPNITIGTATDNIPDIWAPNLSPERYAFQHIANAAGGAIPSATTTPINIGPYEFTLNWQVVNYFYTNSNDFTDARTSAQIVAAGEPAPTGLPDFKLVNVVVGWVDEDGNQNVNLNTVIDRYAPSSTALADNSNPGSYAPKVIYNPGAAPEVIYTRMGDLEGSSGVKREAKAPQINLSQNKQFTEYKITETTYNNVNEVLKVEELKQVNCVCQMQNSPKVTYLPTKLKLILNEQTYMDDFDINSPDYRVPAGNKVWGARVATGQLGQQSVDCDICCRDHHDNASSTTERRFDPFRPNSDYISSGFGVGNHNHYYPDNNGVLQLANNPNDLYLEACNLVKVNGIFRVAQDLVALSVKTLPDTYLLSSGFNDYLQFKENALLDYTKRIVANNSSYPASSIGPVGTPNTVKNLIAANVTLANEPNLDNPALNVSDQRNLRAKTIYGRYISQEVFDKLKSIYINDITSGWLAYSNLLPFYDPDGTNIAQTGLNTSAWGTSAPAKFVVSQMGVLSALAEATSAADEKATATRPDSTTAFTNSRPIDPNDGDSNFITKDDIKVVISGAPTNNNAQIRFELRASGAATVDPNGVTLVGSNGAVCAREGGKNKNFHLCSFSGGSGTVKFSDYNLSGNGNNLTVQNNQVCRETASIFTKTVSNDGLSTENTVISFSGILSGVIQRQIVIKEQSTSSCF